MRQNSALQRIKELESEKTALLERARQEALSAAQEAVEQLNELGFEYHLVEGRAKTATTRARTVTGRRTVKRNGRRRAGIRQEVFNAIAAAGRKGVTRKDLILQFRARDASFQQSISNALSALKKQKKVKAAKGVYRA